MLRRVFAAVFFFAVAGCSHRDEDAKKVVADLSALDDEVTAAVKASPNAAGLGKAEALVAAKAAAIRARVSSLKAADANDAATQSVASACLTKNDAAAANARDYVNNAVLKTDDALRARAKKLSASLCEICEPVALANACAKYRGGD